MARCVKFFYKEVVMCKTCARHNPDMKKKTETPKKKQTPKKPKKEK